ncbi:hypothetical protein DL93DRAFT_2058983 [Clavulina sp. PMI_390]|nr:hypothetical protein DL93DRAFT_2058983 [Clavulina sp. PMI_390]
MSGTNRCRVGVVFTIPQGSYLRFHGHIKLMVISGTVELLGVRIHASPHTHNIFAPCSHPTPSITALNEGNVSEARLLPLRIRDLLPPSATVLGLFPSMTGVESLEQVSPLFRGLFCGRSSNWKIPGLQLQVEPSAHNVFVLPSSWMQAISQAEKHSDREDPFIGVIHGPKGTGKSTFARTLANSLTGPVFSLLRDRFGAVAFLDCDPGQSEFSPPGCLSLHLVDRIYLGPPFTHIIKPFIAHYIGSASAKTDPQYYLSCIQSLLGVFATEIQYDAQTQTDNLRAIPLVINTHGWVKGLGADLTRQIISLANPSHVFDLQTSEVVHQHHSPDTAREPLWIPMEAAPLPNPSIKLNAVDLRGLSLMSYFHSRWDMGESTWTTIKPLASMPPWELQPRIALDSIILGGSDGGIVPSSELGNTLSGGLVGLVEVESILDRKHSPMFPYLQGQELPSPLQSRCLGLAFIRASAPDAAWLHLTTPETGAILARCRVIVKGELELPVSGFVDYATNDLVDEVPPTLFGVDSHGLPYLQWRTGSSAIGGSKRRVRRNVQRRGQV